MSRTWRNLWKPFPATRQPTQAARQSCRPRVEALEARLVPSQYFEAEDAQLAGLGPYFDGISINNYPRVEDVTTSGHTGYTGTGYVNLAYSDDSQIIFDNVTEDQPGDYTLSFRYSMDTYYGGIFIPARPMGLMVNGNVLTRALDFEATGDSTLGQLPWSIWDYLPITVHLDAGANTVELFATNLAATGANPHLDHLKVDPVNPGVLPAAPTGLTASAGVGDVDLHWNLSTLATSYDIYRSTSSGSETLIATGVTDTSFFDTGLASDGTSYFYRVSAVNSAGESAASPEASATPSAPPGLVFSDDFSNGPSPAWTFTPDSDYWQPQLGLLTDAGGDTVANVTQSATVALPNGSVSWQADLLTKEGHGAGVDERGNPGISGTGVQSLDGLQAVYFSVFADHSLQLGTTVNGVWQGWSRVGTAPTASHRGGEEELWHTYQIRLDSGGTFSLIFDGRMLRSGVHAGPPEAWAGGISSGALFTQSPLDDRHLSTSFDNVRVLGRTDGPHIPGGPGHLPSNDFTGAASFDLWRAASAPVQALARSPAAPAEPSPTMGDGTIRLSWSPSARADRDDIDQGSSGGRMVIGRGIRDTTSTGSGESNRTREFDQVSAGNGTGRLFSDPIAET
jgi:hypothetical protein